MTEMVMSAHMSSTPRAMPMPIAQFRMVVSRMLKLYMEVSVLAGSVDVVEAEDAVDDMFAIDGFTRLLGDVFYGLVLPRSWIGERMGVGLGN